MLELHRGALRLAMYTADRKNEDENIDEITMARRPLAEALATYDVSMDTRGHRRTGSKICVLEKPVGGHHR